MKAYNKKTTKTKNNKREEKQMKKHTKIFKIIDYNRLNNSIYGNPRRQLFMEDLNGNDYDGKTATNSTLGWTLNSPAYAMGKYMWITYHYTTGGNMILDYGDFLKPEAINQAGYRELFAIKNGTCTREYWDNKYYLIFNYSSDIEYQDANGAALDLSTGAWIE